MPKNLRVVKHVFTGSSIFLRKNVWRPSLVANQFQLSEIQHQCRIEAIIQKTIASAKMTTATTHPNSTGRSWPLLA